MKKEPASFLATRTNFSIAGRERRIVANKKTTRGTFPCTYITCQIFIGSINSMLFVASQKDQKTSGHAITCVGSLLEALFPKREWQRFPRKGNDII